MLNELRKMNINDFIKSYKNHPVFFIGTGFSLRYLENSYSWDALLKYVAETIDNTDEQYLELKVEHQHKHFDKIATILEKRFTEFLQKDRNHSTLKPVNDTFFELAKQHKEVSRFKIFLSQTLSDLIRRKSPKLDDEITLLKKARKNIGSIITTNYDQFIESIFEFNPLIGNDILLSNPYGSLYKIHGCVTAPESMIITEQDYEKFNKRYELIRAQLLSLFIHNPIIFIGYSISDENIKSLLKTIFTYVQPNSEQAQQIRDNFLLVEYQSDSNSSEVCEHDIDLEGYSTIRINKIKTDNYAQIYKAISELRLPVSAMDIRKVQNVMADIVTGNDIQVSITEDIDLLRNDEKILVIGSKEKIKYEYQKATEMMKNYFSIIEEENVPLIKLLDHQRIRSSDFFPIHSFSNICPELQKIEQYKQYQKNKLTKFISRNQDKHTTFNTSVGAVFDDSDISTTAKEGAIFIEVYRRNISLDECKQYLENHSDKDSTHYRRLLCLYDYMINNTEPL
ncbi:SIR2 family protein, partial [Pasteurella multocida]